MKNNVTNKTLKNVFTFNIFNKKKSLLSHRRKPLKQLFQTNYHYMACYLWLHVTVRKMGCSVQHVR